MFVTLATTDLPFGFPLFVRAFGLGQAGVGGWIASVLRLASNLAEESRDRIGANLIREQVLIRQRIESHDAVKEPNNESILRTKVLQTDRCRTAHTALPLNGSSRECRPNSRA